MKVCGFTIVRNAVKFGYPVVESIKSVLPLCDHFVVAVGDSDDITLQLIQSIDPSKITVIETVWDQRLRQGGRVLAVETNKAFDAISEEFDWCFYIQADEVVHEKDYPAIRAAMLQWKNNASVEGLLFKYYHFWGTFDYIGVNRQWYRQEIRIVRNDKHIRSFRDAQGFRKNDRKLKVKQIDAHIYHYGWVRPPDIIKSKISNFNSLYYEGEHLERKLRAAESFDYSEINAVEKFSGSHPEVMKILISNLDWHVDIDPFKAKCSLKDRILSAFEKTFKYRLFEYKNYTIIK